MSAPSAELRHSLGLLRAYWGRCLVFAWVAGLLPLASTLYMFSVYDRVLNSRNLLTLVVVSLLALACYAVMETLELARQETLRMLARRWDEHMSPRLYALSQRARLVRSGGYPGMPLADFRTLKDGLLNPVVGALMEAPLAVLTLLLFFAIHPLLGWVTLVVATLQMGLTAWNERASQGPLQDANKAAAAAQACADEALRQTDVIAAMGLRAALQARWWHWQSRMLQWQAIASDRAGLLQAATKSVQVLMGSALLGLSAWLMLRNELPGGGGMMIVASVLGGRALAPLVVVVTQWRALAAMTQAWTRLSLALAQSPPPTEGMPLPPPQGALVVEQVSVVPPRGEQFVLKGIQCRLLPGEAMAVIGPSGAGKSSLARVLVGAWPCAQGKVRLDGADIHTWNRAELGPHVGYLPQEVGLLDGSLRDNMARWGPRDDLLLDKALGLAGLGDWIATLPRGLDTPIGHDGMKLSAGQRQRVGLARALYGDPVLVVLDEPNAHLDEAGEQCLVGALKQLKQRGCSVVIITHRTTLLAEVDHMLVLREGVQQAFGTRNDILAALRKAAAAAGVGA